MGGVRWRRRPFTNTQSIDYECFSGRAFSLDGCRNLEVSCFPLRQIKKVSQMSKKRENDIHGNGAESGAAVLRRLRSEELSMHFDSFSGRRGRFVSYVTVRNGFRAEL